VAAARIPWSRLTPRLRSLNPLYVFTIGFALVVLAKALLLVD
jgi:hypothetical protein